MKTLNCISLTLKVIVLIILVASAGCKRKILFDYFEKTNSIPKDKPVNLDNDLPTSNDPTGLLVGNTLFYYKANWWSETKSKATVAALKPADMTATKGCDPCKMIGEGWRLQIREECEAIRVNDNKILGEVGIKFSTAITSASAFVSVLKLPAPGFRNHSTGTLYSVAVKGIYWSSTATSSNGVGQAFHIV